MSVTKILKVCRKVTVIEGRKTSQSIKDNTVMKILDGMTNIHLITPDMMA